MAFAILKDLVDKQKIQLNYDTAQKNYIKAVCKGLLKILSKMGISTIRSYRGAKLFEAVGLSSELASTYFGDTTSNVGGIRLDEIAEDAIAMYQTGASVQPSLSLSGAGLLLTAWGSTDFSNASDEYKAKEFDLTCGYGIGRFNMAVTDYWWSGEGSRYGNYSNSHYFEGTLGFTLGEKFPLSLTWNTMFAGGDKNEDGDLQYSTFIEAKYSVNVCGVELSPSIGISPWTGLYSDGFGLNSLSLKAKKDIVITDKYSLPLFAQVIAAPEHGFRRNPSLCHSPLRPYSIFRISSLTKIKIIICKITGYLSE